MSFKKLLIPGFTVCAALVLSGCGAEEEVAQDGDSPEVTCQRLHDTIDDFSDLDPEAMGFGDILAQVSQGFSELEAIADEAQDDELGQSIDTVAETLNSSIASAGGNVEDVGAELQERLQQPEARDAAAYLDHVCDLEVPL